MEEIRFLLVDSNSIINRAFFANKSVLTSKDGFPTGAILGFFNQLHAMIKEIKPTHIACAFDLKEKTFRHKMYDDYKANRSKADPLLIKQFEPTKQIIEALGYKKVECAGFEGDDILGTLSLKENLIFDKNASFHAFIATGDRDNLQLVSDSVSVRISTVKDKKPVTYLYTPDLLQEEYGLTSFDLITLKALCGDKSDNIPGVKGIGEKSATKLILDYKNLDGIYENIDKIKGSLHDKLLEDKENAYLSLKLGTICRDAPVDKNLESYAIKEANDEAFALLKRYDLISLIEKFNIKPNLSVSSDKSDENYIGEQLSLLDIKDEENSNLTEQDKILLPILEKMSEQGFLLDRKKLEKIKEELTSEEETIYFKASYYSDEKLNLNSPKQLSYILYDKLNLPHPAKKLRSGYYTTTDEHLSKLASIHEFASLVRSFRELRKLRTSYVEPLLECSKEDNKVHTTFLLGKARTGRIVSQNPNLQSIPVRHDNKYSLRECFICDENKVLIDADYSQIELRVLAHLSEDERLISAFMNEEDVHKSTASKIFGVKIDDVTSQMRSNIKAVQFGIIYGMSAFTLANDLNIMIKDAQKLIDDYFANFSKVKKYLEKTVKEAEENGYITTLMGQKIAIAELLSTNKNTKNYGIRQAYNTPIQGSSAEIMKQSIIDFDKKLNETKLCEKAKILLTVHDELIVECEKDFANEVKTMLVTTMENTVKLKVPLKVSANIGKNWKETH